MYAAATTDTGFEFVPAPNASEAGASSVATDKNVRAGSDTGLATPSALDGALSRSEHCLLRAASVPSGRAAHPGGGQSVQEKLALLRATPDAGTRAARSAEINRTLRRAVSMHVLCEPIQQLHMTNGDGRTTTRGTLAMLDVIKHRISRLQDSNPKCDEQLLMKHLVLLNRHIDAVRDDAGRFGGLLGADTARDILRTLAQLKPIARGGNDPQLLNLVAAGRKQIRGGAAAAIRDEVVAVRKAQLRYLANPGASKNTYIGATTSIPLGPPVGVVPTLEIGGGITWGRTTDEDSSIVESRQVEGSLGAGLTVGWEVGVGKAGVSGSGSGKVSGTAGTFYSNRDEYAASRHSKGGAGVVNTTAAVELRLATKSLATGESYLNSAPPTLTERAGFALRTLSAWMRPRKGYSPQQLSKMIEKAHYSSNEFTRAMMLAADPGTPEHRIPVPPTWQNPAHEPLPATFNTTTVGVKGEVEGKVGFTKVTPISNVAARAGFDVQSNWSTVVPRSRTFFWDAVRADDPVASVPGGESDREARVHALLEHLPSINDALARLGPGHPASLDDADGKQLGAMLEKVRYSHDAYVTAIADKSTPATVELVDAIERHWGTSVGSGRQSRPGKDDAVMYATLQRFAIAHALIGLRMESRADVTPTVRQEHAEFGDILVAPRREQDARRLEQALCFETTQEIKVHKVKATLDGSAALLGPAGSNLSAGADVSLEWAKREDGNKLRAGNYLVLSFAIKGGSRAPGPTYAQLGSWIKDGMEALDIPADWTTEVGSALADAVGGKTASSVAEFLGTNTFAPEVGTERRLTLTFHRPENGKFYFSYRRQTWGVNFAFQQQVGVAQGVNPMSILSLGHSLHGPVADDAERLGANALPTWMLRHHTMMGASSGGREDWQATMTKHHASLKSLFHRLADESTEGTPTAAHAMAKGMWLQILSGSGHTMDTVATDPRAQAFFGAMRNYKLEPSPVTWAQATDEFERFAEAHRVAAGMEGRKTANRAATVENPKEYVNPAQPFFSTRRAISSFFGKVSDLASRATSFIGRVARLVTDTASSAGQGQ